MHPLICTLVLDLEIGRCEAVKSNVSCIERPVCFYSLPGRLSNSILVNRVRQFLVLALTLMLLE